MYVHDLLNDVYNILRDYRKISLPFLGISTSEIILQMSTATHSEANLNKSVTYDLSMDILKQVVGVVKEVIYRVA